MTLFRRNTNKKSARMNRRRRADHAKRTRNRRLIQPEALEQRRLLTGFARYIDDINIGGPGETPLAGDFDSDGYADIAVYVPASNEARWAVNKNDRDGTIGGRIYDQYTIGGTGETPIVGDFNGDGYEDIGVYLPNGTSNARWAINKNDRNGTFGGRIYDQYTIGGTDDTPIVGDFNGDGYDDIGVYISNGTTNARWAINKNNRDGSFGGRIYDQYTIGGTGETPIVGDFNGDGYDDIGVYIPQSTTNNARWAINLNNKNGSFASQHYIDAYDIGGPGERPIVVDFNGDGLDDIGIQIPSTQRWVVATTPSNGGVFYHHAHISLSPGETIDGDVVVDDSVWSNPGNLIDGDLSANNSTVRNDGTIQGTTTASHSTIAGDGEYHGGLILDHSVVSPGNGPGVLTTGGVDFGQGSTLRVELNGGSSVPATISFASMQASS